MAIDLRLPVVAPEADPAVEIRAVYVEEWVEGLAYANPPLLLADATESVDRLNTQPLKPGLRLSLLDLHIKPYAFALEFRRAQGTAQSSAAMQRQRDVSRRLRLCAESLALGYRQAASELLAQRRRFIAGKELRTALQRAVLFSGMTLLHGYDEYRPTPPGSWQEIIALYLAAADARLVSAPVPCAVEDAYFSVSIDECFTRTCLTSLVDPYHLAYGELWAVHRAFGEYPGLATITPVAAIQRPAGLFIVDPALDIEPRPLAQAPVTPGHDSRLLNANPLLDALRTRHRTGKRNDDLPGHVLAAMIRALGLPPRRHTPREQGEGRARIAIGLGTVHHFVGGELPGARPAGEPDDGDIVASDATGLANPQAAKYRHERWEVTNEGPGGVGILHRAQPDTPLGVGELVSLQFPLRGDGEDDWTLGVVRWLTISDDDEHLAGVQILSTAATPVMVYLEDVTDTITRIPRPALALPGIGPEPGNTLIAGRGLFTQGNVLRVRSRDDSWLVEVGAIGESTAAFDCFGYRILHGG